MGCNPHSLCHLTSTWACFLGRAPGGPEGAPGCSEWKLALPLVLPGFEAPSDDGLAQALKTCHFLVPQVYPVPSSILWPIRKERDQRRGTWVTRCFGQICANMTWVLLLECY